MTHDSLRCPYSERTSLQGCGEELLALVFRNASDDQLTDWLRLPLHLSAGSGRVWSLLSEPQEHCQIRHKGEELLAVVTERATPHEWGKWLGLPLEHARVAGNATLVDRLLAVGATDFASCGQSQLLTAVSANPAGDLVSSREPAGHARAGGDCWGAEADIAFADDSSAAESDDSRKRGRSSPTPTAGGNAAVVSSCPALTSSSKASKPDKHIAAAPPAHGAHGNGKGPDTPNSRDVRAATVSAMVQLAAFAPNGAPPRLFLHRATMVGHLYRMRGLLARGDDVDATDLWNCTPLHRAAEQGRVDAVRVLLDAGANTEAQDMEGFTPLHVAAARGADAVMSELLATGVSVSVREHNGDTPLHSACRYLSVAAVSNLLSWGADEKVLNKAGKTPADVTGVLPDGHDHEGGPDPCKAREILAVLASAPQLRRNRTWARRAWLVMLRARGFGGGSEPAEWAEPVTTFRYSAIEEGLHSKFELNPLGFCTSTKPGLSDPGGRGKQGCGCDVSNQLLRLVWKTSGVGDNGLFREIVRFL